MEKYSLFNFGLLHLEWTNALFVFVVFSICSISLHFLLFRPIIRTLNNREKSQTGEQSTITELQEKIENTLEEIKKEQKISDKKIQDYKDKKIKEAKQLANALIQKTRQDLEIKNQKFRQELQLEIEKFHSNLEPLADRLVEQLKQKI